MFGSSLSSSLEDLGHRSFEECAEACLNEERCTGFDICKGKSEDSGPRSSSSSSASSSVRAGKPRVDNSENHFHMLVFPISFCCTEHYLARSTNDLGRFRTFAPGRLWISSSTSRVWEPGKVRPGKVRPSKVRQRERASCPLSFRKACPPCETR